MVWVRTESFVRISKRWGNEYITREDVYVCDECGDEHRTRHKKSHADASKLTFCSSKCCKKSRSSGKLAQKTRSTNTERYGVEFGGQVEGASDKMLSTRVDRYGTVAPIHYHPVISSKWHASLSLSLGVDWPMQAESVKLRAREKFMERYGVSSPFSSGSIFREGVDFSVYGRMGYQALALRHGDEFFSKPERMLRDFLIQEFGIDDVVHQQNVDDPDTGKKWSIDFYVRSIDTYIQLDGVFWHGLNKPYEQLHGNVKRAFDNDRYQDRWFASRGMRLVRVTDIEMLDCVKKNEFASLRRAIKGD